MLLQASTVGAPTTTNNVNEDGTSQIVDMNKVLHSLNTAHRNQLLMNQFIEVNNHLTSIAEVFLELHTLYISPEIWQILWPTVKEMANC